MQAMVNGLKIGYDDFGSGPAVVLIHGFPLRRLMWRLQVEPLVAAGYRVVLPDLRGFGESQAGATTSMDAYADDLISLLDFLNIDQAVIGGMSMGGYVLLNLLERYQERLRAAMFIVTRAAGDDTIGRAGRDVMIAAVESGDCELVTDSFSSILFAPETLSERPQLVTEVRSWMQAASSVGLIAALTAMRDRKDYREQLQRFDLPSLVIGGEKDLTIPVEHFDRLAAGLPSVSSTLIKNSGHMVNLESPELFNDALVTFLNRL